MKKLALAFIRFYQRHISPYKGFCCAYRACTGHASCSALGYRAISRFGLMQGVGILRQRLHKCGVAYRQHAVRSPVLRRQAGFCDLPCDLPCDIDRGGTACDLLTGCGSPCDCGSWGSSRKEKRKERSGNMPFGIKW